MKNVRQLIALFLAFVLVIGVYSTPRIAFVEEGLQTTTLASSDIFINYENERLEITKGVAQKKFYTIKYAEKNHVKTEWDEAFENSPNQALIDFSNVSATKDVVFYLTDNINKKPIEITVKAQENTLKVAFFGIAKTSIVSQIG